MSDEKDPQNPATTSTAYDIMASRWGVIMSLLGGTEAMRAAGETFLPKHQEETTLGYTQRIQSAVLLNMVEQTLDTLAGKPFTEPVKPDEDVPEAILEGIFPDVDYKVTMSMYLHANGLRRAWAKHSPMYWLICPDPPPGRMVNPGL